MQPELVFHKSDASISDTRIRLFLDPKRSWSPYNGFVGNEQAIRKLLPIDFAALQRPNHCASDINLAFLGKAGCGKTALVRRHMKANQLPSVEIHPKAVKTVGDIFVEIADVCEKYEIGLIEQDQDCYVVPPINVFIDEVHALSNTVVQALLKATEASDRIVVTEDGEEYDCRNIHWIIATTDRGMLFDAFDTRFSKIVLNMYSKAEIAKIVSLVYPDFNDEACERVAHFCGKVPREALAFAKEMELHHNMWPGTWAEVAATVAENNDIDQYGLSYRRLGVLKAIAERPMAAKNIATVVGVKLEELEKFVLPWLMESTEDQESCIYVSSRGISLTKAGAEQLDLRGIPHSYQFEEVEDAA